MRRRLPAGLRFRLLVALLATSAVTLGVAALIVLPPLQDRLRDQTVESLEDAALATAPAFEERLAAVRSDARERGEPRAVRGLRLRPVRPGVRAAQAGERAGARHAPHAAVQRPRRGVRLHLRQRGLHPARAGDALGRAEWPGGAADGGERRLGHRRAPAHRRRGDPHRGARPLRGRVARRRGPQPVPRRGGRSASRSPRCSPSSPPRRCCAGSAACAPRRCA